MFVDKQKNKLFYIKQLFSNSQFNEPLNIPRTFKKYFNIVFLLLVIKKNTNNGGYNTYFL